MKKYKLIVYSTIFSVFFLSNANSVSLPDFTELAEKYAEAVHVDVEWNEYDDELDDGYGRKVDAYIKKYNLSVNQFYVELQKNDGCCHMCDEPFKIVNFHVSV